MAKKEKEKFDKKEVPTITGLASFEVFYKIPDPNREASDSLKELDEIRVDYAIKLDNGSVTRETEDLEAILLGDDEGKEIHLPALVAMRDWLIEKLTREAAGVE